MKDVNFKPMEKLMKGFDTVADAVAGTLGPKGRNAFISDPYAPKITNDGATIAINIDLPDKVESLGAGVVRNTSSQTNDDAGDGTTTTAVLLQAIVHECLTRPENPMEISVSLKEASKKIVQSLKKVSTPIGKDDIERVALISAEEPKLASLITEVVNKVGHDAAISVEDSKTFETGYKIVDGYEANIGFMSPHFVNNQKKGKAEFEDVAVICSERKISSVQDIAHIFEQFKTRQVSKCVFVVEDIDNSILGVLVSNKLMGNFNSVVIRATGPLLEDVAAVVGATIISEATGVTFQNVDVTQHLGHAKKVSADANKTLFVPSISKADDYADHLEKRMENEKNMFVKKSYQDRINKLRGQVAVIEIAASSDFEREYLKLKAEDAVKAVKAAVAEGVVEGGGMALWRIASSLTPKTIGEQILKNALRKPLKKIVENAGKDYAEIVSKMPENMGYDAKNDKYVEMIKVGIIDPTKVERCAFENAVSAASTFITTFVTITDHVQEKGTEGK